MSNKQGKTVKLFYEQGNHQGIIHAEMINWTGFALVAPRTALSTLYKMDGFDKAGIYFLVSEDDKKVYVGETMNGVHRMKTHDDQKDFWDKLVLVQNKDNNLTKTHCSYLEYRCAQIIDKDSLFSIENPRKPKDYTGILPRPDINDMEVFLENLRFMLPALGITVLQSVTIEQDTSKTEAEFVLISKRGGFEGTAYIQEGQFVLRKGSYGNYKIQDSLTNGFIEKRQALIDKGILKVEGKKIIVTEDFDASSTSTAAAFLTGYSISGPQNWKLKGSKTTYKQWEQNQLEDN
ncbi:GIY-YIG nuclease family protein [Flavivirga sp. 57AJ16]|uniref:GIY-YIG nuclease family protein n=1 Tax=Flavivirga sp. 57AJ16 TaxID=3025307 RepID=UPI002366C03C|nr:GIY-YIG nuclease family protein [Flavivirga sp. 57AJ16]MDD7886133.1 GIY-YIG nuclease family protein [Flavivirga sp. 57AJ16]